MLVDPATENWTTCDDAELWHAAKAGVPQAVAEMARRQSRVNLSAQQSEAIDLARMTVHRKNMLATAARHLAKARKARAAGQHKTAAVHYRAARTIMTDVSGK